MRRRAGLGQGSHGVTAKLRVSRMVASHEVCRVIRALTMNRISVIRAFGSTRGASTDARGYYDACRAFGDTHQRPCAPSAPPHRHPALPPGPRSVYRPAARNQLTQAA